MEQRLQKILSTWGVASRRQAEAMILEGRVVINDRVAQIGQRADPERDEIVVDGEALGCSKRPQTYYFLLNKPLGVVCTCRDPRGRKTVLDFLPKQLQQGKGIHPVGRLDSDSSGALLLTNDGDLTFRLTHPRHCASKVYRVTVSGIPSESALRQWRSGLLLEGKRTRPAVVNVLRRRDDRAVLEIVLQEGRNRQIRKVAAQLGHPVQKLHRVAIGSIHLGTLGYGACRPLDSEEVNGTLLKVRE